MRYLLVSLAILVTILLTLSCGGGTKAGSILEGSPPDCNYLRLYLGRKVLDCNEEEGVALLFFEKENHYTLDPIKVTSLEDWRAKRDRGFEAYKPLFEERGVDICSQVGIDHVPDIIQPQLKRPEDIAPPGCLPWEIERD